MSLKASLKLLLRSRSLGFVINQHRPGRTGRHVYNGRPIYYRTASSDMTLMHDILFYPGPKAEYWLPLEIEPRVIWDLGGNIGLAAIYLADRFPGAVVHTCEPVPDNYALLERNIVGYGNIRSYNLALGRENGRMEIQGSARTTNYGGASLYGVEVDQDSAAWVEVRRPDDFLAEAGITGVDLIKIDTEGAEYDILTSLDPGRLSEVKWIIGELHGVNDFKLLDYLSGSFLLDVRKTLHKRYFRFNACNKQIAGRIPRRLIKWLQY
ncbi:MAG: FkbM family methyltransferase [Thermodesulfobacteriota bacterium]